jgi:hypothetical protein
MEAEYKEYKEEEKKEEKEEEETLVQSENPMCMGFACLCQPP